MARITSKKQLEIFECETDGGGVGLLIDGVLFMGYGAGDLERLLAQVFIGAYDKPPLIDGDLYDLAHTYLDEASARERLETIGD